MNTLIGGMLLLSLAACGQNEQKVVAQQEVVAETLPMEAWKDKMNSEPGLVLDVRTHDEVVQGMIPGATNIDILSADLTEGLKEADRNTPVYVYCAAGGRSKRAMTEMSKMGFTKVYDLQGGYTGWAAAGGPVVKP